MRKTSGNVLEKSTTWLPNKKSRLRMFRTVNFSTKFHKIRFLSLYAKERLYTWSFEPDQQSAQINKYKYGAHEYSRGRYLCVYDSISRKQISPNNGGCF